MTARLLLISGAGVLMLVAVAACGGNAADPPAPTPPADAVALSARSQQLAGIVVEPVVAASASGAVTANGMIALDESRTARIGALVEGLVSSTHVAVGDRVGRNGLLAGLHSHEVHDGWADYRKAVANRRRVGQDAAFAADAVGRAERLLQDKAASTLEVERARSERVAAEERVVMADAEVRRAQESLEHLGITATAAPGARTTEIIPVRSPIAGIVLERLVTDGTAVTPGTPLFVVSDLARLWVLVEVDETALSRLTIGAAVTVRVAAYGDETFPATIAFVADTINPTTRRAVVRCTIANTSRRLKPGMFATVTIAESAAAPTVQVPVDAVQDIGERRVVFVPDGQGHYRPRDVEVGSQRDGRIEVRRGLASGDRIVTRGAFLLKSQLLASPEP